MPWRICDGMVIEVIPPVFWKIALTLQSTLEKTKADLKAVAAFIENKSSDQKLLLHKKSSRFYFF